MEQAGTAQNTLGKVLRVASVDSLSVLVIAGCALALCLLAGYWMECLFCGGALGAGALEWRGRRRLASAVAGGFRMLIISQLLLLAVIVVYAVWRLFTLDAGELLDLLRRYPLAGRFLADYPQPRLIKPVLEVSLNLTYGLLIVLSMLFQGGLAVYYALARRRLAGRLVPPPAPRGQ